jgi:Family of unknown function (DUF6455)
MKNVNRDASRQKIDPYGAPALQFAGLWHAVSDFIVGKLLCDRNAELDRCGGLDAVLRDVGVTRFEIKRYVRNGSDAAQLFPAMAKRRGVMLGQLTAATIYRLQQNCALCPSHRRCRRWLANADEESREDRKFCWNDELFDAVVDAGGPLWREKEGQGDRYQPVFGWRSE